MHEWLLFAPCSSTGTPLHNAPHPFLMHLFENLVVPNDLLLLCDLISPGCLLTVSALPQNLNSDALKFGRRISTLMPVFIVPEDTPLERKLIALPLLLNIGYLLDLLFSRGLQIHSGESPGTNLWNPELFPVLEWISSSDWRIVCFMSITNPRHCNKKLGRLD